MEQQPSYYTNLPAFVRYDDELLKKPKSILLYGEIVALSNQKGYSWATNSYFAKRLKVTTRMIQDYLDLLVRKHYVTRKLIYKPGTKIVDKRILSIDSRPREIDFTRGGEIDFRSPGETDFAENTTRINTTRVNKDDDDPHNSTQPDENPFDVANKANINVNSGYHMPVFVDFIDKLGASVVCWAIHKTDENARHPNWNYLQTVLKGLEANSVRTVEQAEQLSEEHKQKAKQDYRGRSTPQVREDKPDWMTHPYKAPDPKLFDYPDDSEDVMPDD